MVPKVSNIVLEHRLDLVLLGDVGLDGDGVLPLGLDLVDDRLAASASPTIVDDDVGAGPARPIATPGRCPSSRR